MKYKNIVKDDIVADFKVSMATDEIGRIQGIEVEDYMVEEQLETVKEEAAAANDEIDEPQLRARIEATLLRQAVMDFLAENADLEVEFIEGEEDFDESLMEKLAEESLARDEVVDAEVEEVGESPPMEEAVVEAVVAEAEEAAAAEETEPELEPVVEEAEPEPEPAAEDRDTSSMSLQDKAFYALMDSGALNTKDDSN